ncbi:MAG TPA: gluconate 2-dehydrogenase subunit 3 family protein [Streptosporangiaceae bacterium]|jgi:hypothetical protein
MTGSQAEDSPASAAREETLGALAEQIFPESPWGPGARRLGLAHTVRELACGAAGRGVDSYRQPPFAEADVPGLGWQWQATYLEALDHGLDVAQRWSVERHGVRFAELPAARQADAVAALEDGTLPGFTLVSAGAFFELLYGYIFDALFVMPAAGAYSLDSVWERLGIGAGNRSR